MALDDGLWDKPAIPMPHVERQLLSEAGVQCLFARHGVTTEAGSVADGPLRSVTIYWSKHGAAAKSPLLLHIHPVSVAFEQLLKA
jgi:hypothetical protein